ncbi:RNA polymerase II subunit A C-terminal domain phosphatase [Nosema granulosis]|uniref:RNA polymerase II subunit A C-terminal domain phosphatase n=1 Tax=Nosema granulosis TaxID=83296 RepID=A0A9P6H223_9MICR|nr:RNA polymerase II subunit A C-terminal domain phosphatase [Nosema granulosis]
MKINRKNDRKQLDDDRKQLDDDRKQLDDDRKQLDDYRKQLDDDRKQLVDDRKQLDDDRNNEGTKKVKVSHSPKLSSSKLRSEDRDMFFLTDLLLKIHNEYYENNVKDVREILLKTKNIFKNTKFYLKENLSKLIEMYGGVVVDHLGCSDIFLDDYPPEEDRVYSHFGPTKTIPVVSTKYIHHSIYKLRKQPLEKYILGRVEHVFEEDSADTIDGIINDLE